MAPPEHRLLSSFGRRKGRRLRPSRQALVDDFLPTVSVELPESGVLSPEQIFGRAYREYWLEIGFGAGEHMAAQALEHADAGIIGSEPYINGLVNLLAKLQASKTQNVRIFADDVRLLMEKLPPAFLSRVFILFPDPWPKVRHHKRRLVQKPFLEKLAALMQPGGELVLATDHADYLTWMLEQALSCPQFEWTAKKHTDWENPPQGWVRTGYQEWAETEGRKATYLIFVKKGN